MNCLNNITKKTNKFGIIFFTSVLNILKSGIFNLFVLTLGFCLGYYALALKVHYYATVNDDYGYIIKIENHVKELELMDNKYTQKQAELLNTLKGFKYKLSHDSHHECDSVFGSTIYK